MDLGIKDVEELIAQWREKAAAIAAEMQVLKNAGAIVGDDLMRHSVELWEMKAICLQRCVIDLQQLVVDRQCEAMRVLEEKRANV